MSIFYQANIHVIRVDKDDINGLRTIVLENVQDVMDINSDEYRKFKDSIYNTRDIKEVFNIFYDWYNEHNDTQWKLELF